MRRNGGLRTLLGGVLVVAAGAGAGLAPAGTVHAAPNPCSPWSMHTIKSGLGVLEDLQPDTTGGMLLSSSTHNSIERVQRDGSVTTVLAGTNAPGAQQLRGNVVYFATGDSSVGGALGSSDGTIDTLDLGSGHHGTYATGLVMPNGMAFDARGNAFVTRDVGLPVGTQTGITRVPAGDPGHPQPNWAALQDTNGIAVAADGRSLYADQTFTADAGVFRIDLANPGTITRIASLSGVGSAVPKGLDDMTIDGNGILYLTANGSGEVFRLDPAGGAACVIASGLQNPSSLKFGRGPGWPADHLFVVGFDGTLRELTPPAGVSITPPTPLPAAAAGAAPSPAPTGVIAGLADTSDTGGAGGVAVAAAVATAAAILLGAVAGSGPRHGRRTRRR